MLGNTQWDRVAVASNHKEAIECGTTKYLGSPCKHGHGGIRYTKCKTCVSCNKDSKKKHIVQAPNWMVAIDHKLQERDPLAEFDIEL